VGLTKGMMSSDSVEWETPDAFFDRLDEEFGFEVDVCATKDNAKCDIYFTPEVDGLAQSWGGLTIWCNPPYGKDIGKWIRKCADHGAKGGVAVMLIHARTDTKWFHDLVVPNATEIRFVKGRLKFSNKGSAPFPSLVAVFGSERRYSFGTMRA